MFRCSKGEKIEESASAAVLSVLSGQSKQGREVAQQRVKKDPTGALTEFLAGADELAAELNAMRALEAALKESDATALLAAVRDGWPQMRETQFATCVRDELSELLIERITPAVSVAEALQSTLHGKVELPARQPPDPGRAAHAAPTISTLAEARTSWLEPARGIDQKPQPSKDLRGSARQKPNRRWRGPSSQFAPVATATGSRSVPERRRGRGSHDARWRTRRREAKPNHERAGSASSDDGELGWWSADTCSIVRRERSRRARWRIVFRW